MTKKTKKKSKKRGKKAPAVFIGKCAYCSKLKPILTTEIDDGWGGDNVDITREICNDCSPDVDARYACAALALGKLREQLKGKKKFSSYQVNHAVQLSWKTFHADLDTKAMVKMARKLKIKHPWLKGKRSK